MKGKTTLKEILIIVAGWILLILGFIGLFLPVLQGVLFIFIGLYILSHKSPWAYKLLNKLKYRFPRLTGKFKEAQLKGMVFIRKILHPRS